MESTDSFPTAEAPERRRRSWARPPVIAAVALALVASSLGVFALATRDRTPAAPAGAVSSAQLEDRYGVRVDLVALTALGGLLQLRFTVLDKDKAEPLFHDDKPHLLVEDSGALLSAPKDTAHKMTLLNGASYFLFYTNADNAAHRGSKVSVVIDRLRLEHVDVKA